MEKERKITAPEGCEIEKVELIDGVAVITFREKKRKLPKSWDEHISLYPVPYGFLIDKMDLDPNRDYLAPYQDRLLNDFEKYTENRSTAEAILALCQLIQLRNCYNGDWVPDWTNNVKKYVIEFSEGKIETDYNVVLASTPLYFKSEELREEFLRNFRQLIEKLKPLYGIKEGGEE